MGDFTRVKSPMKIHGRFYLSKKTPDYKMTHQLFTLFWIISNILTFHFYTFSVIYTFYFYIAFEELTFYQKCSIKCVLYSLFYTKFRCFLKKFWLVMSINGYFQFFYHTHIFPWMYCGRQHKKYFAAVFGHFPLMHLHQPSRYVVIRQIFTWGLWGQYQLPFSYSY